VPCRHIPLLKPGKRRKRRRLAHFCAALVGEGAQDQVHQQLVHYGCVLRPAREGRHLLTARNKIRSETHDKCSGVLACSQARDIMASALINARFPDWRAVTPGRGGPQEVWLQL